MVYFFVYLKKLCIIKYNAYYQTIKKFTNDIIKNEVKYATATNTENNTTYELNIIEKETISLNNQTITRTYTTDSLGRVTGITDSAFGNKNYVYDDRGFLTYDNGVRMLYDENDMLFGFIYNNTDKYYYVRDILLNILGIVDNQGTLVVKYDCNAWGKPINGTNNNGIILDTTSNNIGSINPFRYKGYYYDDETEFFYCNSRYYSPELCRFISPDSIEYLDSQSINGFNLYCYCMNNPIMYADPSGHWIETVFDLFSFVISVVEAVINPYDPLNWAGLAGDALDFIPFVTGVGETVRGMKVVAKGVNMADDAYDTIRIVRAVDLSEDALSAIRELDRTSDFTQSTMSAGRRIHKGYKTLDIDGKEFRKFRGIRPDYFDEAGKLVYELKPYNIN